MKRRNLTTSIFSSDASDFLALALALAVIDKTAVVTYNETRIINHCTFLRKISSRPQGKKKKIIIIYQDTATMQVLKLLRRLVSYNNYLLLAGFNLSL